MLARTGQGDTVFVYFQGHGNRDIKKDGSSSYYFINYDAKDGDDNSYWYMRNVFDEIDRHFKGSQAIIIGDCCCSGGLLTEAKKRKSHVAYACLASVFAHNSSTSAWTFTEAIVRGFKTAIRTSWQQPSDSA